MLTPRVMPGLLIACESPHDLVTAQSPLVPSRLRTRI